jgi:hypothetical protein
VQNRFDLNRILLERLDRFRRGLYDQSDFLAIGFVFHLVHDRQGSGPCTDNQPLALTGYFLLD